MPGEWRTREGVPMIAVWKGPGRVKCVTVYEVALALLHHLQVIVWTNSLTASHYTIMIFSTWYQLTSYNPGNRLKLIVIRHY